MVYVFIAPGFEEIEAIAPVDILKRAGIEVVTVGVGQKNVSGAHGIAVICDIEVSQTNTQGLEGVILPGGPGHKLLQNNERIKDLCSYAFENTLLVGAICAAPSVLGNWGMLNNRSAVCYPGYEKFLGGANVSSQYVCTDKNLITARGVGAAIPFALEIAAFFKGHELSEKLARDLQCRI